MRVYVVDYGGVPYKDSRDACACLEVPDVNTRFFDFKALDGVPAYLAARLLSRSVGRVGHFGAGAGYMERLAEMCFRHPHGVVEVH